MKNIVYIFLLAVSLSACNSLETEPTDRIISSYFWNTEADAIMAVNGIYRTLPPPADYMYLDCASDLMWNTKTWEKANYLGNGSQNAENWAWAESKWRESYQSIQRSNYFLENIDDVENMNPELKNRLKAEARFIRAFHYSDISFFWGDVPLVVNSLDIKTGNVERTPKVQVLEFVYSELKDIAQYLPESYDGDDIGRVTRGAAKAMLMRAYLRENNYDEAKATAKEIIDMGRYTLFPNYATLFQYDGENNAEIIFDKQYIPTQFNHNLSRILSTRSSLGESSIVPLRALVDSYEMLNGKAISDPDSGYDPYDPYANRDPRLKQTILTPGDIMQDGNVFNPYPGQTPVGTDAVDNTDYNTSKSGFNFKKYVNEEDLREANNNGHINIVLIRYAEVLLSYAEAKIETNDIDQSVYDAINAIRLRAGMPEIEFGKSQQELREVVRQERKVEFPLEGIRYFDIRRWKIAEEVIPGQTLGISYIDETGKLVSVRGEERKFNPARDYLWPIPAREMNVNRNLVQNPLY